MSFRNEIENVGLSNSAELYFGGETEAGEVKISRKVAKVRSLKMVNYTLIRRNIHNEILKKLQL
jgi:hypothetical protein